MTSTERTALLSHLQRQSDVRDEEEELGTSTKNSIVNSSLSPNSCYNGGASSPPFGRTGLTSRIHSDGSPPTLQDPPAPGEFGSSLPRNSIVGTGHTNGHLSTSSGGKGVSQALVEEPSELRMEGTEDYMVASDAELAAAMAWKRAVEAGNKQRGGSPENGGVENNDQDHHRAADDVNDAAEIDYLRAQHQAHDQDGPLLSQKLMSSLQQKFFAATRDDALEDRIKKHEKSSYYDVWFVRWMNFLKKYFLLLHAIYLLVIALITATVLYISERHQDLPYLDALFIAISCVSCTGLTTVDMTKFNWGSIFMWHLAMTLGGTVFTSAVAPLTRLYTLKRLLKDEEEIKKTHRFSPKRELWGRKKRQYIRQLIVTSSIVSISTYIYWSGIQFLGFLFLLPQNSAGRAITRAISLFANCAFSSAVKQVRDTWTLVIFCFLIPLGSALFPPLFRLLLHLERRIIHGVLTLQHRKERVSLNSNFEPLPDLHIKDNETVVPASVANNSWTMDPTLVPASAHQYYAVQDDDHGRPLLNASRMLDSERPGSNEHHAHQPGQSSSQRFNDPNVYSRPRQVASFASLHSARAGLRLRTSQQSAASKRNQNHPRMNKYRSKWISGFNRILKSDQPGVHHPFLFKPNESMYLVVAWAFIVAVQLFPFFFQQWNGQLGQFSTGEKVVVGVTQTIGHRFAGLQLINLDELTPGHILLIMFALYVPMLPIPTDRTRRKWKEMLGQGVWRLFTSRFWWLFIAVNIIVFVEEGDALPWTSADNRFHIISRVLFETLSAYATAGLSLPLTSQVNVSLTGGFKWPCKVIIMLVMFAGRHRGMDLGLDIGLSDLAQTQREAAEKDPENEGGMHNDHLDGGDFSPLEVANHDEQIFLSATNINRHNKILVDGASERNTLAGGEYSEQGGPLSEGNLTEKATEVDPHRGVGGHSVAIDDNVTYISELDRVTEGGGGAHSYQESSKKHPGRASGGTVRTEASVAQRGGGGLRRRHPPSSGQVFGHSPQLGGSSLPNGYMVVKKEDTLTNVSLGNTPDEDDIELLAGVSATQHPGGRVNSMANPSFGTNFSGHHLPAASSSSAPRLVRTGSLTQNGSMASSAAHPPPLGPRQETQPPPVAPREGDQGFDEDVPLLRVLNRGRRGTNAPVTTGDDSANQSTSSHPIRASDGPQSRGEEVET